MIPKIASSGAALGAFAVLAFACAPAGAWGAKKQESSAQQALSPKVGTALRAAQELAQKQDWNGAFAKVQEAQGVADKKPYDDFQIAEMLGYIELKRQNYAQASAAFEQSVASVFAPPEMRTERLKLIAQIAKELKDYPKAIQFAGKAIESTQNPDPELFALLGEAQYLAEDYKAAAQTMGKAVEVAGKAGKPVKENWLQVRLSGYAQAKDVPGVLASLQELAIAFPKQKYLTDLFGEWKRTENDDRAALNLYRLMLELGLLKEPEDYLKMAQLAVDTGMPGEAVRVLEQGTAGKMFSDEVDAERAHRQLSAARTLAAVDRKTLEGLQATAERSSEDDVQLGLVLVSFGEYAPGAEALQRGLAKGGIKRPDQAQILLGQALVKLNRPAEAQAAFTAVEASSRLKTVAELWRVYTQQPSPLGH